MSGERIEFLVQLLREGRFEQNLDAAFLESVLTAPDARQREGDPERYLASFALERAKSRLESAQRFSRRVSGLESVVENMSKLPEDVFVDFYNIEARGLVGTCFVYERRIVGYEFVVRGGRQSLPGLHPELL